MPKSKKHKNRNNKLSLTQALDSLEGYFPRDLKFFLASKPEGSFTISKLKKAIKTINDIGEKPHFNTVVYTVHESGPANPGDPVLFYDKKPILFMASIE